MFAKMGFYDTLSTIDLGCDLCEYISKNYCVHACAYSHELQSAEFVRVSNRTSFKGLV